jgi:hypothetical protein
MPSRRTANKTVIDDALILPLHIPRAAGAASRKPVGVAA